MERQVDFQCNHHFLSCFQLTDCNHHCQLYTQICHTSTLVAGDSVPNRSHHVFMYFPANFLERIQCDKAVSAITLCLYLMADGAFGVCCPLMSSHKVATCLISSHLGLIKLLFYCH